MFGIIKEMSMGLLIRIVNASYHTKCVSLSNQKCMIQPTLINLHYRKFKSKCVQHDYRNK